MDPSVCGWNAVDGVCLIPSCFAKVLMELARKRGSLSEIILSGSPYLTNIFSISIFAISFVVMVLETGVKITPFVSPWSTTDKIASKLSTAERSVMRSHEICANG